MSFSSLRALRSFAASTLYSTSRTPTENCVGFRHRIGCDFLTFMRRGAACSSKRRALAATRACPTAGATDVPSVLRDDHPRDAEAIGEHAERGREECLGERQLDLSTLAERIERALGVRGLRE